MIVDNERFEHARTRDLILCKCDFCGDNFERTMREIKTSHRITKLDSCRKKECKNEKVKMSYIQRFGCEHPLQNKEVQEKQKQTNRERYGCDNPGQNKEVQEKIKETNRERLGCDNPFQSKEVQEKIKETNQERYGCDSPFQNKDVQEKIKETNRERLGCDYPMQNKEVQEKQKQTNRERYGCDNPSENKEIQEKRKETVQERFGCEHPWQNKEVREKIKETNQERYGVENPLQNKDVQEKMKETNRERYGCEHPMSSPEVQQKTKQTNLERYGVECTLSLPEVQQKIKDTNRERYGVEYPMSLTEVQEKGHITKIDRYGTVHPNIHFGKTQKEIQDFLNSFGCSFVENDYSILGNKEIDLYDCNKKIAIEYCGLYWHTDLSPQPRDKNYHYDKHNKCLEKDIHLITIFEDEWVNRNSQCKNVLKSILGIYDLRVYARKCTIIKLDKQEFHDFCDEYHLQGKNALGQIFYGLKHENTLVAAMSFGSHHRNNHDLVLDRFCCKGDVQVVGGASRLFKACLTEAKTLGFQKVVSWSDNRWRQGTVYEQLGFVLEEELGPDYSYVDLKNTKNKRISKQSQQKKYTGCPADKTETQWAHENGLARIWDCGKKRWVLEIA